jgi:hypothetical protein
LMCHPCIMIEISFVEHMNGLKEKYQQPNKQSSSAACYVSVSTCTFV